MSEKEIERRQTGPRMSKIVRHAGIVYLCGQTSSGHPAEDVSEQTQEVLAFLLPYAQRREHERFLSDATIFLEFFSTLVIAWQWLKMGVAAKTCSLTGAGNFKDQFHESTLLTMRFYFSYELARMTSMADVLMNEEELTLLKEKDLVV